jgi:hypothetical protein
MLRRPFLMLLRDPFSVFLLPKVTELLILWSSVVIYLSFKKQPEFDSNGHYLMFLNCSVITIRLLGRSIS